MASVERRMDGPPYRRKPRNVPFQTPEEIAREREEITKLEQTGLSMIDDGIRGIHLLMEMHSRAARLLEFAPVPEAKYDYARACVILADVLEDPSDAEKAAVLLRELAGQYPDEKTYLEELRKAEAVFERLKEKYGRH